jgi:diguanylate cyclase (GGDEF)-like protein
MYIHVGGLVARRRTAVEHTREPPPVVKAASVALLALTAAYIGSVVLRPAQRLVPWFDVGLLNFVLLTAGLLCLLRALFVRPERLAWVLAGVGVLSNVVGNLYFRLAVAPATSYPAAEPSWADAAWLAGYPCAYLCLLLLMRERAAGLPRSIWLDGLVGLLAAGSLAVALTGSLPVANGPMQPLQLLTSIAYPLGDGLLVAVLVGVAGVSGWRLDRPLQLLVGGLALTVAGDIMSLVEPGNGDCTACGVSRIARLAGLMLIGLAAWQRQPERSVVRLDGVAVMVPPITFASAALMLLVVQEIAPQPVLAVALAAVCVLGAFVRLTLTFHEVRVVAGAPRRQTRFDELTGLPNRRAFFSTIRRQLGVAPVQPLAVLIADLDRFKEVNDSLGHGHGDELIRLVAARLASVLTPAETMARLGGDEFGFTTATGNPIVANELARRLLIALRPPFQVSDRTVHVSASIGITLYPRYARTASELLQQADVAMYQAKATRDSLACYDPGRDARSHDRLSVIEGLRVALEGDGLFLHYQPKVRLDDGQVVGAEALVRWRHPQRGVIPPDEFIPAAEQAGLTRQLTTRVLEMALAQVSDWRRGNLAVPVAVNLAATDLLDPELPDHILTALRQEGLPPHALRLEVTEGSLITDQRRTAEALLRLRRIGVGLSLDDFGTGYSSLAYLIHLPVDELKLDKSFLTGVQENPRSAALVQQTVALGHSLGLTVVAEGIEDAETFANLRAMSCDVAQGVYISWPLPPEMLTEWLVAQEPMRTITGHRLVFQQTGA